MDKIKKSSPKQIGAKKSRTITQSRVLYLYVIFGGIAMFLYGIACIFTGWPFKYIFIPIIGLIGWVIGKFTIKNFKVLWMYANDVDRGKLHLALNNMTHFSETNKMRLVEWVYPKRNQVRNETWLRLGEKVRTGQELTKDEKKQAAKKVVICPQQVLDGVNKAILVYALIHAHKNICVLDDEIREILELTDEHMDAFNIEHEIDKCRKDEYKKDYDRRMKIGMEGLITKNASK